VNSRLLIIGEQRELRLWLRHQVDVLWPDAQVEEMEPAELSTRGPALRMRELQLIVLCARCDAESDDPSTGFETLKWLLRYHDVPPTVVIATGGNELSAVRAMQLGASDYLPRELLSGQRLATAIRTAMRAPRRSPTPRQRTVKRPRRRIDPAHLNLPHYSVLQKLGESSRAAVYLAHSASLGRNVALKISKPVIEANEECNEFAREYAAICAVRHRSVVEIYDYGFHDGREFISMEYFPCGDLKMRLQQPITPRESLEFTLHMCDSLVVVHQAGLIHRDLKPPNVMLREDGSIVLIDFGIAKGAELDGRSTAVGVLRGSPYYMSPEQAQGLPLDARSDLYSIGVMLFELLSGFKPYTGSTAIEVMQKHVHGQRPRLPAELLEFEALLAHFMSLQRDERFPDAIAAAAAVRLTLARLPSTGFDADRVEPGRAAGSAA
jgi:eukaryotic-like serine/threonine-protein kinase